jgi:GTPase-activator protein for Ras-like GTPase/C2 domain
VAAAADAGQSDAAGNTIRTVTPDSIPEERDDGVQVYEIRGPSRLSVSTPASPLASERGGSSSTSTVRQYRVRAGSNNELGQRDQSTFAALRPRTRTLESRTVVGQASSSGGTSREASPLGGVFVRRRLGSISGPVSVSGAGFGGAATEDVVTSIGHPSTIPPPTYEIGAAPKRKAGGGKKLEKINNSRDLPVAHPIQEASPPRAKTVRGTGPSRPQYQYRMDPSKILPLMKSSSGKMEGQLAFRRVETTPWALSYCSINDEAGSLVYEPKSGGPYKTLIPDIRSCNIKSAWDPESQAPYLDVCPQNSKLRVHLRPHSQEEFDAWFAALLCWQPIPPKGAQNRKTKPQLPHISDRKITDRRHSEVSIHKEPPIIKIGKMIYWDTSFPAYSEHQGYNSSSLDRVSASQKKRAAFGTRKWQQVSSTLRENGELKLHDDNTMALITTVHLAQLSRCAVQRLDSSVLETEFCIAIYPQYSAASNPHTFNKPIFLSLESRVLYEVWVVLLRAFTIPELYGPKQALTMEASQSEGRPTSYISSTTDMFRMERSLSLRVTQARLVQPMSPRLEQPPPPTRGDSTNGTKESGGYYAEILLDGEIRARTSVKANEVNPSWRDDFAFVDLPAAVSVASVVLKKRAPNSLASHKNMREETRRMQNALNGAGSGTGSTDIALDQMHGQVDIFLDDLESGQEVDKWWPLNNQFGQQVGEVLIHVKEEDSVILMAKDYQPMSELLHRFANGLTLQLAAKIPGELRRLSNGLLNIFQVSGSACEWINSLIEEEIDGTLKENSLSRTRFNKRRMSSNENGEIRSHSPQFDRELFLRDMNKSATLEANLLFRGNTILTKSLDLHMKRLGKDYLDEMLGDKLREIGEKDPDCEVDPNRLTNQNDLDANWRRLIKYTSEVWTCIVTAVKKCPPELRYIFRHVRACADDRYGDYIRSVKYSSVSGFLFLRFLTPAILNPQLPDFALLKGKKL